MATRSTTHTVNSSICSARCGDRSSKLYDCQAPRRLSLFTSHGERGGKLLAGQGRHHARPAPARPTEDLILIQVELKGPRNHRRFTFALDTGCSETLVAHEVIDEIGYNARDGEITSTVSSPLGREQGFTLRVAKIAALGYGFDDFRVGVHDLSDRLGIDGLLGLSFMRQFNYEIRSREGHIVTARA